MTIDENLLVLLLALLLDRIAGDPQWLWSRMPHPVVVFGAAISYADRQLNPASLTGSQRRMNGIAAILALLLLTVAAGFVFNRFFALFGPVGILLETGLVAIFLAQKSLADHVAAVALALRDEGLPAGGPPSPASSGAIPRRWTSWQSAARRSKASPRISPTASSRRRSGMPSSACRGSSPTRC